ncbi:MAG: glycosyltransferase [Bacillus sp. (in: firmicutes)]
MNIMVFDVPAETSGALSVLRDFYQEASTSKDTNINWIFVVGRPQLEEKENVKVVSFPWIKKSWLHRLFFDYFIAPKLVKQYRANRVFSLQNVIVPCTKVSQILYLHQPLPFIDHKFSFFDNKKFWLYQNVLSKSNIKSIQKAEKVIVQTEWMKKACVEKSGVGPEKMHVVPPLVKTEVKHFFKPTTPAFKTFFYPATEMVYKNHSLIVEACKELKAKRITDFKVIFTLLGNENDHVVNLYREVKEHDLPIEFAGNLPRDHVFELYTKSILLFPSYIETFGLPLLEAMLHKGIVLASDCPFSREILGGYENAYFFDAFKVKELSNIMERALEGKIQYKAPLHFDTVDHSSNQTLKIVIGSKE